MRGPSLLSTIVWLLNWMMTRSPISLSTSTPLGRRRSRTFSSGARSTRLPFSSVTGTSFSGLISCWADLSSVGGGPWSTGAGFGFCAWSPSCSGWSPVWPPAFWPSPFWPLPSWPPWSLRRLRLASFWLSRMGRFVGGPRPDRLRPGPAFRLAPAARPLAGCSPVAGCCSPVAGCCSPVTGCSPTGFLPVFLSWAVRPRREPPAARSEAVRPAARVLRQAQPCGRRLFGRCGLDLLVLLALLLARLVVVCRRHLFGGRRLLCAAGRLLRRGAALDLRCWSRFFLRGFCGLLFSCAAALCCGAACSAGAASICCCWSRFFLRGCCSSAAGAACSAGACSVCCCWSRFFLRGCCSSAAGAACSAAAAGCSAAGAACSAGALFGLLARVSSLRGSCLGSVCCPSAQVSSCARMIGAAVLLRGAERGTALQRERAQRRGCHQQAKCRACQYPWLAFHQKFSLWGPIPAQTVINRIGSGLRALPATKDDWPAF